MFGSLGSTGSAGPPRAGGPGGAPPFVLKLRALVAAVRVDGAAGGLARIAGELRVLDDQDAVAEVRDCAAVMLGVVVAQPRVADPDRADAVELPLVGDRARV